MARRRSFGGGRFSRGERRLTQWGGLAAQGFVNVAAAGATLLSSITFEAPGTLVRARGRISLALQAYSADLEVVGAFGMGMVSREALDIGVTALPEPFTDADWGGWMVWQPFALRFEFLDGTGTVGGLTDWSLEIDSKAMRKVEANTALVFVAESFAGAFKISETVRVLQKLH